MQKTDDFASETGKGVRGMIAGRSVALGNAAMLADLNVDPGALGARAEGHRGEGETIMFVAVDGVAGGLIAVADPIERGDVDRIKEIVGDGHFVSYLAATPQTVVMMLEAVVMVRTHSVTLVVTLLVTPVAVRPMVARPENNVSTINAG